jgi:molybdopterin synthase sulfur carrier subunit
VASVVFTQNLKRHVECPDVSAPGASVREVLDRVFADHPRMRGYVVDEQGALRKHMVIFIDGRQIDDRQQLSDPVLPGSELYVMQALSGGA